MKNLFLTSIFSFIFPFLLSAQSAEAKIDSLLLVFEKSNSDTVQIKTLNNIASISRKINLDEALKYTLQSIDLCQTTGHTKGKYENKALYNLGVIYRMMGNMDNAVDTGKKGLKSALDQQNYRWAAAHSSALGNTYSGLGVLDTATIHYFNAVEWYEKAGLTEKTATVYNNIGNMMFKQKKGSQATEYLQKALSIYTKYDRMDKAAMTLMNLGRREKSNDSLALDYFQRSLAIHTQNEDIQGIASVNMNIGSHLMAKKNYEAALPYYQEGLRLVTKVGHRSKMATANSSLGKIYFYLNESNQAIQHYETAISLSEKTKFRQEEKETYNSLAMLYSKEQNYSKAFEFLKTSRDLGDSLLNKQKLQITSELEAKFDAKQKEADLVNQALIIERQKNSKNKLLIGGILLVMGLLAAFQWIYFRQKQKERETNIELKNQKAEAENLRELDQLKTRFFANISHELKTPLSMVITPIEEVLTKTSDDNLLLAHQNSKKVYRLIREILDLSKLEAGQLELKTANVSLHQLTRRILFSFQSIAQRQNITLDFKFDLPKYLRVEIDVEKFEKILDNLISNAIKFSKPNGTVSLEIFNQKNAKGEQFIFNISDNGTGIGAKDLDKIFDRYYQGPNGKKRGGTGIGLALSKELAQLFGGDLKAESTLDYGSTFTLQIPLEKADPSIVPQEIYDPEEKPTSSTLVNGIAPIAYQPILLNGKKPEILIVEDNYEMADFLDRMLSPYYNCHLAYNGLEALQKLGTESYDLITSDVMMPEMDGFEFRKTMNENAQWRQTPFIMLTASEIEQDRLKGFNLGIDDYITKPFSSKELLARVENLLKNKSERDKFNEEDSNTEKPETANHQLLKRAEQIVLDNIHNLSFKVPDLAKEIGYSQRQLTRIIKKLTGLSPVNFILEIRLQKAYQLFQNRQFSTVSEVRYEIGIESAAYFTTKFKERFGKNPKEFLA